MFCTTAYARAVHPVRARIYGSASRVVRDAPNGVTGIGGQVGIVDLRGMMRFCRGCQNLLQMQAAPRRGRRSDANMQVPQRPFRRTPAAARLTFAGIWKPGCFYCGSGVFRLAG